MKLCKKVDLECCTVRFSQNLLLLAPHIFEYLVFNIRFKKVNPPLVELFLICFEQSYGIEY